MNLGSTDPGRTGIRVNRPRANMI